MHSLHQPLVGGAHGNDPWLDIERPETNASLPGLHVSGFSTLGGLFPAEIPEMDVWAADIPEMDVCLPELDAHAALTQDWLGRRMQDVRPLDFDKRVCLYTIAELDAPAGFEHLWRRYNAGNDTPLMSEADASRFDLVLVFANHFEESERRCLCRFLKGADDVQNFPPVLLVPHTSEASTASCADINKEEEWLFTLLEAGLDGVVEGEPSNFALVLQVRSLARRAMSRLRRAVDTLNLDLQRAKEAQKIREVIQNLLWRYLRHRVGPVTGHGSRVTGHRPRVTGHGSRVTGHRSQVTGHGSRVTGHRSQVTGHKSQVTTHKRTLFLQTHAD